MNNNTIASSLLSTPPHPPSAPWLGRLLVVDDAVEQVNALCEALAERVCLEALGADVVVALTQSDYLRGLLQHYAEAIGQRLEAAFARIWMLNDAQQVLELQASAGLYTHLDGPHGRVPVDQFKIGLIAQERKPYLTNTVIGDPRVSDQDWAKREGIVAFAGYPLIVDGREVLDIEGQVTESNPTLQTMLGYCRDELCGIAFPNLTHPDDVEKEVELYAELISGERDHYQIEKRYLRQDSKEVWGRLTVSLVRSAGGLPEFAIGMVEDIKEYKRAEQALQQEVQITAALARVGHEIISSLDTPVLLERLCQLTTEILACDCSHAVLWQPEEKVYAPVAHYGDTPEQWEALRVMKIPREAVIGSLAQIECEGVIQITSASHQEHRPEAVLLGVGVTGGYWVPLQRGEEIIGGLSAGYRKYLEPWIHQRERLARGVAHLASLALTNVMLFEELTWANQLKSAFLATMSHELRTPLNAIIGYTDLTLEGDFGLLTSDQIEALQVVKRAAKRELELIIAMLDVSQLEAGRLPVVKTEVNVAELIAELKRETERTQKEPDFRYEWRVPPGLPQLHTDRTKLRVVLQNLLSNAVKFTERGSVTVDVYPADGGIEFCIADTGIGIALEVLPVMFEMFRQGDSSSTRPYEGVGLGLYVVRRLLEIVGGTVAVESEVGHGSKFRV